MPITSLPPGVGVSAGVDVLEAGRVLPATTVPGASPGVVAAPPLVVEEPEVDPPPLLPHAAATRPSTAAELTSASTGRPRRRFLDGAGLC
jgi:hypothetical protein